MNARALFRKPHAWRACGSLLMVLGFLLVSDPKGMAASDERPAVGNQPFVIPDTEIPRLQDEALRGSGAAAYRLAQYYDFAAFDHGQGSYWMAIAAENGDIRGVYGLGLKLARSDDRRDRVRARYWLERARREAQEPIAGLAAGLLEDLEKEFR